MVTIDRLNTQREKLQRALDEAGNTHTIEDLAALINDGRAFLWEKDGSLIITEMYEYPQKKVLNFWVAVGEREPLILLQRLIVGWARGYGCSFAVFTGRKGWSRTELVSEEGWSPSLIQFRKEV